MNANSQNVLSSNSFNSNTFSSGLKSRSKKHSEDYSFKSDMKLIPNDARDLQTYPKRFLPQRKATISESSKNGKESSSNSQSQFTVSQKNLTKKILERIESEQNHLSFQEDEKSPDLQNNNSSESKSLTEIEEDILHTVSNKRTDSQGYNLNEVNISQSLSEEFKAGDKALKKNVTFSNRISRAKTYDLKLDDNNSLSKSRSVKSPNERSIDEEINNSNDEKKKMKSPERIYEILKQKKRDDEKGADKIFKNIAILMLVNHFVRQIKLKSGHFGKLGQRQLKILNDLCTPNQNSGNHKQKDDQEHANILVRMIRQNQLIQKTLKKSNVFKKCAGVVLHWIQKKVLSRIKVIMPNHKFKFTLNCFVLVFSITEFGFIPLNSTFQLPTETFYSKIRNFLILVFVIDILLNFNTGYFQRGTLILNRKEILKRYIRLDFWVESLTILPSIIINVFIGGEMARFGPEINFFEFVFLIRIVYLDKMIRKICDFYQSTEFLNNFVSLLKLCVWSLYVAHLCACMFHYVSYIDLSEYHETWISNFRIISEDDSLTSEYITSLYWSVTTMVTVGYGDVIPVTPHERIVAITSMLGACCVFAYIMNSIGGIINSFNNRQTVLRQKIQAVNKYLDMKNIDNDLRIRIRKYLEYLYEEKNAIMKEGHSVVSNLSSSLKTEIFQRLNGEIIVNIPILMNNFSLKLLSSLTLFMNEVSFTPEDFIFDENLIDGQELFFIYEGEVELYIQNTTGFREDTHLKKLQKGDFFGEIAFFTGAARSASAISLDFSSLINIRRSDFLQVIKNSSYDYEKLCMIRDNITLYQNYNQLNIRCFCCNYTNHIAKDCPMVHVIINPQRVIRDHIKIEPTNRRQFPRFSKKFKALKNMEAMIHGCIKIHRTTTLEMSTVTIEQDENDDDEQDEDDEQSLSQMRPMSPMRKFGSSNLLTGQSFPALRSKSSNKIPAEEMSSSDEKEKNFRGKNRKERRLQSGAMTSMNFNSTSMATGMTGGFESYINNMNAILENERSSSPMLSMKKKKTHQFHTQTTIPKTPRLDETGISPKRKKTQTFIEGENKGGKYTEHQKMMAEALMLQGISSGPNENFTKLSYNELMNQFDKMKSFEIYFPHNNVEIIVEVVKNILKSLALKRRKSRYRKRNSSFSPNEGQQHQGFYNQMSFRQIFKGETLKTVNSNYEDLMYRRALTQNEGSPAKKLRLLPTKSLNFSKGFIKKSQTMKKKISKNKCLWMCFTCKKKKFKFGS